MSACCQQYPFCNCIENIKAIEIGIIGSHDERMAMAKFLASNTDVKVVIIEPETINNAIKTTVPYKAPRHIEDDRIPNKIQENNSVKIPSPSKHQNKKYLDPTKNIKKRKQQKKARRRNRK